MEKSKTISGAFNNAWCDGNGNDNCKWHVHVSSQAYVGRNNGSRVVIVKGKIFNLLSHAWKDIKSAFNFFN